MRRANLVVLVAAIALMMIPTWGIGVTTHSHGGSPTDVYASTDRKVCNRVEVKRHEVAMMKTPLTVGARSQVVVTFTATASHYARKAALLLELQIYGPNDFIQRSPTSIVGGGSDHWPVTATWVFRNIAPADYTIWAVAWMGPLLGGGGANLQGCALTVLVAPTVT
jgi:hypothetical protein